MKINFKNIEISNSSPIIIIAGLNVFEDLTMASQVASDLKKITDRSVSYTHLTLPTNREV